VPLDHSSISSTNIAAYISAKLYHTKPVTFERLGVNYSYQKQHPHYQVVILVCHKTGCKKP